MSARTCLAIVLAAGEGTRMRSSRPKVLHTVAGRSLLAHVLAALRAAGGGESAVVVGPDREDVAAELRPLLDLPVELVMPAHGEPTDRAALARALS